MSDIPYELHENPGTPLNLALKRARAAEQRLAALEAALPKTADGVTIVPGLKVWVWHQKRWTIQTVTSVNSETATALPFLPRFLSPMHRRHPETGLTPEEAEAAEPS